jgi:endothelin-converting enzyme/putative endopeptidase
LGVYVAYRDKKVVGDLLCVLLTSVDKTEWYMSPQTVNAYYNPAYNCISGSDFEAPFYNYQADEAVNYGGIGAVIGHEISHGFDDSGARYNADGNLIDWWTEEDLTRFTALGTALADHACRTASRGSCRW